MSQTAVMTSIAILKTSLWKFLATILTLVLLANLSLAAQIHQPGRGSPERRAILEAIRSSIETQMNGPVEFVITTIKSDGEWALVIAEPQRPGGAAIDAEETTFAGKSDEMDGLTVYALARKQDGDWSHVTDIVGSMDVAYLAWAEEFGVPGALLGLEQ